MRVALLLITSLFYAVSAETPTLPPPPSCTEGTHTTEDCNECICVDGGLACTRRFCLTAAFVETINSCKMPPLLRKENQECQSPGNKWTYQFEEQKCVQIAYGGCDGSKNLFDDEESCHSTCGFLGLNIETRISALPPSIFRSNPECTEGTTTKRDCNTCVCIYGREVCTRKLCSPGGASGKSDRCLLPPVISGTNRCESLGYGWLYNSDLRDCVQIKFQCQASESVFKDKETCRATCKHLGLRSN
ncbi:carboxypeptidase inhibitor SmCI-like [Oratosquilla oratoria]|uniref:carboxypeptidase inhibitor SmCI-like n=1 Tax=Oratosquilla oratoria TaxID=337810 RepID=UPI003F75CE72